MSIEKSEPTKPFIVGIGEKFYPYTFSKEDYFGFPPDDTRFYRHPKAVKIKLHTGVLPDLDFQIVTIPREVEKGKSEIIIESSIQQALQLGLLHKIGRRSGALPSFQHYGFNEDVLPLFQRLRFSFLDSEKESEGKPEMCRTGQVQFKFIVTEDKMTPDLGAKFDLAEDSIEEGIKPATMGDPEKRYITETNQGTTAKYLKIGRSLFAYDENGRLERFVGLLPPEPKPGRPKPFRF